jgi:Undecaprenyl-phosphate galactose phosphotransferase WbaP
MRPGSSYANLISLLMAAIDLLAVAVAFVAAYSLRLYLGNKGIIFQPLAHGLEIYLPNWPIALLWPFILWREGLYPGWWMTPDEELKRTVAGSTLAGLIVIVLTFVTQTGEDFSRPILASWWLFTVVLLPLHHLGSKLVLSVFNVGGVPAVILGANEVSARIIQGLEKRDLPPVRPVAIFSADGEDPDQASFDVPIEGGLVQAAAWARSHAIQTALLILPQAASREIIQLTETLSRTFPRILVIPDLYGLSTVGTDVRDLDGVLALEVRRNLLSWQSQWIKHIIDYALALLIGLLCLPLGLLVAGGLWLERQGSIFYGHERVGRGGQTFTAWKFRTMVRDADQVLARALSADPRLRVEWETTQKLRQDPRLTRMGRLLRRLSLDELPQLWNIVKMEMSLVGPRPIIREEIHKYGQAFELYAQVRPGLTGLWQVSGRSNLTYEDRVRLDAYYVRNWSIWLDLVVILRTSLAVLTGRGAY